MFFKIWRSKDCGPWDSLSVPSWISGTPFAFPHHAKALKCGLGTRKPERPFLLLRAAVWNCTRASCLVGICSSWQCMPWFSWRYRLMVSSSTAHPLPERWLRSHCAVPPIRYAIPLVVHASKDMRNLNFKFNLFQHCFEHRSPKTFSLIKLFLHR